MNKLLRAVTSCVLLLASSACAESGGAGQPGGGTHWDCVGLQVLPLACQPLTPVT